MKKTIAMISALAMLTAFAVPFSASAEDKGAVISTEIQPTYVVNIPANLTVAQNAEKTNFGAVTLASAQIEPDKCITVTLNASGALKNKKDNTKTLPYTIYQGKADAANLTAFTSATYLTAGESTDLTVGITAANWRSAFAGEYSDTVTFRIAYANKAT